MNPGAYAGQSVVTDPGVRQPLLEALPADVEGLRALVLGLVIHAAMGPLYHADLREREDERHGYGHSRECSTA